MVKIDLASSTYSVSTQEDTTVWDASGSLASAGIDKKFVIGTANILQTLLCLNHLTRAEANDSSKVLVYANLTSEKLQALRDLLRPLLWNAG